MLEFDTQPRLVGDNLSLLPLAPEHREGLRIAAGDPQIWAQHPVKTRSEPEAFARYFDFLTNAGGTLVAQENRTRTVIGCSRYYTVPDHPGEFGIGFTFLDRAHWGGLWNREMKGLMLNHAFQTHARIWIHIDPGNRRSQIASMRVGAVFQYDADLDMGAGPAPFKCYTITPESWRASAEEQRL